MSAKPTEPGFPQPFFLLFINISSGRLGNRTISCHLGASFFTYLFTPHSCIPLPPGVYGTEAWLFLVSLTVPAVDFGSQMPLFPCLLGSKPVYLSVPIAPKASIIIFNVAVVLGTVSPVDVKNNCEITGAQPCHILTAFLQCSERVN